MMIKFRRRCCYIRRNATRIFSPVCACNTYNYFWWLAQLMIVKPRNGLRRFSRT